MINIYENFVDYRENEFINSCPFLYGKTKESYNRPYSVYYGKISNNAGNKIIPESLSPIIERIQKNNYANDINSVIINYYLKGNHFGFHKDPETYGGIITVISLFSECDLAIKRSWEMNLYKIPSMSMYQIYGGDRSNEYAILPVNAERISIVFLNHK